MSRPKTHRSHLFDQKIHAIIYEGAPDKVTPAEFVRYLLETHKENGLFSPITRDEFSLKVKNRAHYFTELLASERPDTPLPVDLAASLANLTNTEPFFWRATSYSLAQAKDMVIDLSRPLPPTSEINQPVTKGRVKEGSPQKPSPRRH